MYFHQKEFFFLMMTLLSLFTYSVWDEKVKMNLTFIRTKLSGSKRTMVLASDATLSL